jgi:hypothetical protein
MALLVLLLLGCALGDPTPLGVVLSPFLDSSTPQNVQLNLGAFSDVAALYSRGELSSFRFNLGLETITVPTMTARTTERLLQWTGTTDTDMGELVYAHLTVAYGPRSSWKQGNVEVTGEIFLAERNWKVRTRNSGVITFEHTRLPVFHVGAPTEYPDDEFGLGVFHRNISFGAYEEASSSYPTRS